MSVYQESIDRDKALKDLVFKLGQTTSMLERYHLVEVFVNKFGDTWHQEMGADCFDFFCSDCGTMLPLDLVGGYPVCADCEGSYNELWN